MLKITSFSLNLTMNLTRLHAFFSSNKKIELEIGCGNGGFLIQRALRHPNILFIGIDIAGKWLKKGEESRIKKKIKNILFIRTEASFLLTYIQSIYGQKNFSLIHIYCPDPWPKKRHLKKRFFSSPIIIQQLHTHLIEQGHLSISTDHIEYNQQIQYCVRKKSQLFKRIDWTTSRICDKGNETAYALKFSKKGDTINYIYCYK